MKIGLTEARIQVRVIRDIYYMIKHRIIKIDSELKNIFQWNEFRLAQKIKGYHYMNFFSKRWRLLQFNNGLQISLNINSSCLRWTYRFKILWFSWFRWINTFIWICKGRIDFYHSSITRKINAWRKQHKDFPGMKQCAFISCNMLSSYS